MKLSAEFILKILRASPGPSNDNGKMCVVIQQPYDHVISQFKGEFWDQQDVDVKIDSRKENRRKIARSYSHERRQTERRRAKVPLVEVVLAI